MVRWWFDGGDRTILVVHGKTQRLRRHQKKTIKPTKFHVQQQKLLNEIHVTKGIIDRSKLLVATSTKTSSLVSTRQTNFSGSSKKNLKNTTFPFLYKKKDRLNETYNHFFSYYDPQNDYSFPFNHFVS